jgi:transcriptional regulator with XRE-family HTH domain
MTDTNTQDSFGQRLRQLRALKGLTQMELGQLTEVSQVYIGRLEKGSSQPTADIIKRLAQGLDVTAGYLIEGDSSSQMGLKLDDLEMSKRFRELQKLAPKDKEIVNTLIDAFLFRRHVQDIA